MPRQANVRKNRSHHSEGQGSSSPRVNVQQQHVYLDNFRPGQRARDAQQFASALDNFTSAMATAEHGLFADMRQEKERKGAIAGFLGIEIDAVPDEPEDAALRTREKMRGKIATVEFKSKLDDFYHQNRDLDPMNYSHGLQQLKQEFLKGRNRSFIEGFLSDAMEYEADANISYHQYHDAKDTQAFMDEVGGMAHAMLQKMNTDPRVGGDQMAELLHMWVGNAQDLGKAYKGIDRDSINEKIIDSIGIMAVREGRPDWLNFSLLKDEDGIALWDTKNKEQIATYIKQAERQRDAAQAEALEAQELALKEREAEAYRTMVDAVYSDDPTVKQKAMLYLTQNRALFDPNKYEHLVGIFDELRATDTSFVQNSDEDVLTDLLVSADNNNLELSGLRQYKGFLSRDDYIKVFERIEKAHAKALTERKSKGKGKTRMDKTITDVKSSLKSELLYGGGIMEKKNPFGTDLTRKRQRWGMRYFGEYLEERQAEKANAKEKFTYEDLDWVVAKSKRAAYMKAPPMRGTDVDWFTIDKVAPDPDANPKNKPERTPEVAASRPSFDDI